MDLRELRRVCVSDGNVIIQHSLAPGRITFHVIVPLHAFYEQNDNVL